MKRGVCILALLASLSSSAISGSAITTEFSVEETLQRAQFNTTQMPPEKKLIAKYGTGRTLVSDGEIYHVYFIDSLHLWLRCRAEADDKVYKPISEVMISRIDLGTRIRPKIRITNPNLKGIRIGDSIEDALRQWGTPLRKYAKRLGKKSTIVYEFFPDTLGAGSCLRFFIQDKTILAFSFSSEE